MSLLAYISRLLGDPRLRNVDYDSDELLNLHRQILLEKRMMREVFAEFYDECIRLDHEHFTGQGRRVEIGAGVSFFKELHPEITSTDIKKSQTLDMVVDAVNMPFEDGSVRAFYGINCFHHFPDPDRFFDELKRTLVSGGGCVLIEPYHGFVAQRVFRQLFATETFDVTQAEWKNEANRVMSGANQALSYIVFIRDRGKWQARHPGLELVDCRPMNNHLRYLLSGGLNFRSLLPGFSAPFIKLVEWMLTPLNHVLALHHVIVIRKNNQLNGVRSATNRTI
jgi:SAM-dependent methyltransferase